jgi:hypothetical protein
MRPSPGICFHTNVLVSNCLTVIAVHVIHAIIKCTADKSMVWVRDGDKTFVLCARYMRVLAEDGGMLFGTPDARLAAELVQVVVSLSAWEAIHTARAVAFCVLVCKPDLPL